MHLKRLTVKCFRNLEHAEIWPDPKVNVIYGRNASGKTSLLESIFYLSHVRSFRSPHLSDLIQHQSNFMEISALISNDDIEFPLGLRRDKNKLDIRLNREAIRRVSDIAIQFPVLAIHPDSYKLISGNPAQRRQYLDWGVFHVEPGFNADWQRFRRALAQRNAALRTNQNKHACESWNSELSESAEAVDRARSSYMDQLRPFTTRLMRQFFPNQAVSIEYRRGWDSDQGLKEVLSRYFDKDRQRGYTQTGPHRAELKIMVDGQSAQYGISRGQQKLLIALLRLAQAMHFTETTERQCVLLYDDLAAELDQQHREMVLDVLSGMSIQLFLTVIDPEQLGRFIDAKTSLFHVEQGQIKTI